MTREAKGIAQAIAASVVMAAGLLFLGAAFITGDWRWLVGCLAAYLAVRRTCA